MIVEAAISPFDGDYRKAIKDINSFVERLDQLPDVRATVIVEPLDVRANAAITSTDSPQAPMRPDARFVLKLVRSVKVPRR